ncbi:MAG: hypothetical protein D3907_11675, partial [Candidatus Electrothrix sp. AUS3]|nr:hypothetical protein [Candidatus Electrothrix gigas]
EESICIPVNAIIYPPMQQPFFNGFARRLFVCSLSTCYILGAAGRFFAGCGALFFISNQC